MFWLKIKLSNSKLKIFWEIRKIPGDGHLLDKFNLGLDRVDNTKWYELSNIVLCCNKCNAIKGGFFNYQEMKAIGENFVKPKWQEKGIKLWLNSLSFN